MNQQPEHRSDQFPLPAFPRFEIAELGARLAALEGEVFLLKRKMEDLQQQIGVAENREQTRPAKG